MREYRIVNQGKNWYAQVRPKSIFKYIIGWRRISFYLKSNGDFMLFYGYDVALRSEAEAEYLIKRYEEWASAPEIKKTYKSFDPKC